MSSKPQVEARSEPEERPRLARVEIGGWPGLGANVGFDLGDRVTVLVGKNGAGKSLIMEGLNAATGRILSGTVRSARPTYFRCNVARASSPTFIYEYTINEEFKELEDAEVDGDEFQNKRFTWNERCSRDDIGSTTLWSVRNAQLTIRDGEPRLFAYDYGLVAREGFANPRMSDIPTEAKELADICNGVQFVSAGIPRGTAMREEIILRRNKSFWEVNRAAFDDISILASTIMRMHSIRGGAYDEFVEILKQMDVARDVKVRRFVDQGRQDARYASIEFDGVNLGLCSDGTQRVAQIIAQLLSPRTRCLLIEEPETAVHPGLLARLLAILDSYSHDRQIVIATHSPQIVDWCKPEDLRLVERSEGQTRVRNLNESELGRVHNYLAHDGTLSDFVYRHSEE